MKALEDIIMEVDERRMPEDASTIEDYIRRLLSLEKKATSRTAMLVATVRRKLIKNGQGLHKWTRQFSFSGNYTSHMASVGDMLLDAKAETYSRLSALPYNKLEPLSTLETQELETFISEHDVEKAGRDELRAEIGKLKGREPKKDASKKESLEFWAWVNETAKPSLPELGAKADDGSDEEVALMVSAGGNLMAVGLSTMIYREIDSLEGLEKLKGNLEKLLALVDTSIKKHNMVITKEDDDGELHRAFVQPRLDCGGKRRRGVKTGVRPDSQGSRPANCPESAGDGEGVSGLQDASVNEFECGAVEERPGMDVESNAGALLRKEA